MVSVPTLIVCCSFSGCFTAGIVALMAFGKINRMERDGYSDPMEGR